MAKIWGSVPLTLNLHEICKAFAEVVQQVAEYFSVLGEPMRLRILNLLRDGEKCVQDLVEATDTSQANVSKHLKVMMQAGILNRRSKGTLAYYSVEDDLILSCAIWCAIVWLTVLSNKRSTFVRSPLSANGNLTIIKFGKVLKIAA